jgi:hypothetical protein
MRSLTPVLLAALALAGCRGLGPRTVPSDRFHYNEAIARSWNEQLLLNLVRLRHRHTPLFLEIDSVVTKYSLSGSASAGASLPEGGADAYDLGLSGKYSESPTITYVPLQGADFAKRLLSPIPPTTLLLLAQSGWSVDRLFLACVQQVNEVRNAPATLEGAPAAPNDAEFRKLARLLREHHQAKLLDVRVEQAEEEESTWLHLRTAVRKEDRARADEIARMIGIEAKVGRYRLLPAAMTERITDIALLPRSVMAVMAYLSDGVQLPGEAEPRDRRLRVRSAARAPDGAFVRVRYRDSWYFIAEDDLESKSTFGLLTQLFSIQSTESRFRGPLITLPAGD